jgi:Lrp/AsnC family transcriptional regulator for asnA, asnC and gidA
LTGFVVGRSVAGEVADQGATLRLDELDRRILRAFRFGARLSNAEIARQVEVSEGTVRRRISALHEAGVLRFVAIADPRTMGFHLYTLIGIKADGDKIARIAQQLAELPEVPYAAIAMGSYDIWITALLPSPDDWLEFRARLAEIDGIRDVESFQVTRVLKQNFDWVVPEDTVVGAGVASPDGAKGGKQNGSPAR